ncbi:hypothetical protein HA402_013404 [Bradysia odoriphaga]|nr:hypothetical protein HA402_013404 [Bradysia odoriphaga]
MSTDVAFEDVEDALEKFNGDKTQSVTEWVTEFDDIAKACGWNDIQKYVFARKLLQGAAKKAVEAYKTVINYSKLVAFLKEEFEVELTSYEIHKKLRLKRKSATESYLQYFYDMKKIGPMLDEASMIRYIVDGLSAEQSSKLVLYDTKTLDELKTKLKLYEKIYARRNQVRSCGQLPNVLVPLLTNAHATHRWPWHVAIYHQYNESSSTYQCGGTLISSNSVLTAAHCVLVTAEEVTVSLGRLLLDASESSAPFIKIAEIIRHPRYTSENQDHDIAIILLETHATFNNYVQPVCLWRTDKTDLSDIIGRYGTVVGWGRTNVCSGDSGGSMTFEVNGRYYIRGVVSVGPGKFIQQRNEIVCDPTQFTIFTDVVQYLPWIRNSTKINGKVDGCDVRVPCGLSEDKHHCTAVLDRYIHSSSLGCRTIFDGARNSEVTELTISGESDVIPELSDAATKFRNLDSLVFEKMSLKVVEREQLAPFGNIRKLNLSSNGISQFDSDTFDDLNSLTKLDISYNKLTELHADLFKKLAALEFLDINGNRLAVLPANIFRFNWKFQHLKISFNQLKEVHTELFNDLRNLEQLELLGNKLETLPTQLFHSNRKIQVLNLGQNQLKELHADLFKELINLEYLYVHTNRLELLPADIFLSNGKLRQLAFSQNQLKELHVAVFKELSNLEILNVHTNELKLLPADIIRNNTKLRQVSFARNQLKELPIDLFNELHNLEKIYLYGNELEIILPGQFKNNLKLTYIDLGHNHLKEVHVEELRNLETLLLRENKLEVLPVDTFNSSRKLHNLDLSVNQLKELHVDLFLNIIDLQIIYLHANKLELLPADIFRNNKKLQQIALSDNQLKELHADLFKEVINLEFLVLNTNKLEVVPADIFRNNRKLRGLGLGRNQLIELSIDLFKELPNLEVILLNTNQLEIIPPGLFRNNQKLTRIDLSWNKIKKIEPDFHQMTHPALKTIVLSGNVCIDDMCGPCDDFTSFQIFDKIDKNC